MHDLNDLEIFKKFDKTDIAYGIEHLPEQVKEAVEGTRFLTIPEACKKAKEVVVVGMGGSLLGPHIAKSILSATCKVSFTLVNTYRLPAHVGKQSLVILSSFSGTTEEVLEVAKEVKKRGCPTLVITSGGGLEKLAKKHKWPYYLIVPGDLARQPRLGVGFSLAGVLGLLDRAGFTKFSMQKAKLAVTAMEEVIDSCALEVKIKENPAKQVAEALYGKQIVVLSADHLEGSAHTLSNQINESAKQLSGYHIVPELNHHYLEGTLLPDGHYEHFAILILSSKHYHPRNAKRLAITADLLEERGAEIVEYAVQGDSPLEEAFEVLQFGSFLSYYLGILNGVDPEKIPFVDLFKKRMAE